MKDLLFHIRQYGVRTAAVLETTDKTYVWEKAVLAWITEFQPHMIKGTCLVNNHVIIKALTECDTLQLQETRRTYETLEDFNCAINARLEDLSQVKVALDDDSFFVFRRSGEDVIYETTREVAMVELISLFFRSDLDEEERKKI